MAFAHYPQSYGGKAFRGLPPSEIGPPVPVAPCWRSSRGRRSCRPALGVGLALWIVRGFNGKAGAVRLSSSVRRRLEISTTDSRRGLAALRGAGLVRLVKGGRGRCPVVEIVDGKEQEDFRQPGPGPVTRDATKSSSE